jgi:hypothetical protein
MPYYKFYFSLLLIALTLSLFFITGCDTVKEKVPKPDMEGTWTGLGRTMLSNEYLNQREIPVMLIIEKNGYVTGYVGDASIMKTKLLKPAWWLALVGMSKYKAAFKLSGGIVSRESFSRDGGTITIESVKDGEMLCSFQSTGNQINSNNLALEIRDIRLTRPKQQ